MLAFYMDACFKVEKDGKFLIPGILRGGGVRLGTKLSSLIKTLVERASLVAMNVVANVCNNSKRDHRNKLSYQ